MAGNRTKVLYVEDEEVLAMLVRDHLTKNGYEVHWTADGAVAEMLFKKVQPDICILDVMLPGKSGFEIGKSIRQLNKSIPVIYLTAKSESKDVVEGFKSGGNDYLRKPFSLEELMVRISNLLSMSGRSKPDLYKIGQLSFDPVRMTLENGKDSVVLSHRA